MVKNPTINDATTTPAHVLLWRICFLIPAMMLVLSGLMIITRYINVHAEHRPADWAYYYTNLSAVYQILKLKGDDSWIPMLTARQWLTAHPGQDVYEALFFGQGLKFQYPLTSLLFIEWLRVESTTAVRVLNMINIMLYIGIILSAVLLARGLAGRARLVVAANREGEWLLTAVTAIAVICFYPMLRAAALGQIQILLDVFFVLASYAYLRDRSMIAGILLGLSTLIKPQMGLFLIWGLLRRDRSFVVGWLAPVVIGVIASSLLYDPLWPIGYLKVVTFIGSHGEGFFANQSFNGVFNRLMHNGPNLDWEGSNFPPFHPIVYSATVISTTIFVLAGLISARRRSFQGKWGSVSLMFAGACFTMASPVAWEHHYGVLFPLFVFCLISLLGRDYTSVRMLRSQGYALASTFFFVANSLSITNWLADSPLNVLQSYTLFASIVLLRLTWTFASEANRWTFRKSGKPSSVEIIRRQHDDVASCRLDSNFFVV